MLPHAWIDELFARLSVRYGAAFLRQWPDADIAVIKADWARALSGLSGDAIKAGLDSLPDRPPLLAGQFRRLALDALPGEERRQWAALPAPKVEIPESVRKRLARLRSQQEPA
jgi:hypothetical protein